MKAVKNITTESLMRAAKKARNNRKPPEDAAPEYVYMQAFIEGAEYMRELSIHEESFLRRKIDELKASVLSFKKANNKLANALKRLMKKRQ